MTNITRGIRMSFAASLVTCLLVTLFTTGTCLPARSSILIQSRSQDQISYSNNNNNWGILPQADAAHPNSVYSDNVLESSEPESRKEGVKEDEGSEEENEKIVYRDARNRNQKNKKQTDEVNSTGLMEKLRELALTLEALHQQQESRINPTTPKSKYSGSEELRYRDYRYKASDSPVYKFQVPEEGRPSSQIREQNADIPPYAALRYRLSNDQENIPQAPALPSVASEVNVNIPPFTPELQPTVAVGPLSILEQAGGSLW